MLNLLLKLLRLRAEMKPISSIIGILLIAIALPVQAQITPALDGTKTQINPMGSSFDITGGTRAGANLFHSFQQFGLNQGQIANFLSSPSIQNILGRVTGGDASIINGLVKVTGGNSNLYLMNPAGIVFGPNASLNVSGSFTATTASGIGFGDRWFNAIGDNNYAALSGMPDRFAFTMSQPGAIVNEGKLTVGQGQSLALIGGAIANTGTLTATGGQITIEAVPGESLVRISQPEQVLSLEVRPVSQTISVPERFEQPTFSLPELLTGGRGGSAKGAVVNRDGTVSLTGSGLQITPQNGTVIVSGTLDVSDTALSGMGGGVQILGDRVALQTATVKASGTSGGGTILVGGDYKGKGTVSNAQNTYVSPDSVILADAINQGNGGRIIIWADNTTDFHGNISARGGAQSGNGGFAEVSGKRTLNYRGNADLSAAKGTPGNLLVDPDTIVIRSGTNDGDDNGAANNAFGNNVTGDNGQITQADPVPSIIYESELEGMSGVANINLEANNGITIETLADGTLEIPEPTGATDVNRGSITFNADADGDGVGNFSMNPNDTIRTNDRNLTIYGATITTGNINTIGPKFVNGSVEIVGQTISTGKISAGGGFLNTSSVKLTATTGDVIVKTIATGGGGIEITAARYFRATDSFTLFLRLIFDPVVDADLIQFLSKGDPQSFVDEGLIDGTRQVFIDLPTSLFASPDSGSAPITIKHGGEARTVSSGQVQIQGNGNLPEAQFVVGPNSDHTITIFPAGSDPSAQFDNFSTLFPANAFPDDLSGATGAIVRGQGDATLVTSLQNRPFDPSRVPPAPTPGGGLTGNTESNAGNIGSNTASVDSNVDANAQTVQRQFENQSYSLVCAPSASTVSAASNRSTGDGFTAATASSPCTPTNNDEQILKILDESSTPVQDKTLRWSPDSFPTHKPSASKDAFSYPANPINDDKAQDQQSP